MKYGPIICNPDSEEAKALIGKKVVVGNTYTAIDRCTCQLRHITLVSINSAGFYVDGGTYPFIREVIEEKPKYRPYKDTEEMVEDFKKRFCGHTTIPQYSLPLIWIKGKGPNHTFLVHAYLTGAVKIGGNSFPLGALFAQFTYLDGSSVGMEVSE